jgi:hypothetical protein
MNKLILALFALPMLALAQGSTNDYIIYQKPASGPLVSRAVTPTVGRLLGWPTSINSPAAITLGTGLSLSGSTLNATASSAWADLTGVPANLTSWAAITRASGMDTFTATPTLANLSALVSDANIARTDAAQTLAGVQTLSDTTASTGTGTGALQVAGGIAAAKDSFFNSVRVGRGGGNVDGNLAVGASAMPQALLTGVQNTSIGAGSLVSLASSSGYNTAVGYAAGQYITGGFYSTLIGDSVANLDSSNGAVTQISEAVIIGHDARPSGDSETNTIIIGANSFGLGSNTTVIGNSSTTAARIFGRLTMGTSAAPFLFPASDGTNGQALVTNGSGTLSFATISSGATLAANTFTGLQQFSGTTHAGLRLNNLTTVERDALSSPAAGMAVWNTTDGRLQLHNGSSWTSGMVRLSGDTMTGALINSTNGAASTSALSLTGTIFTGGTGTTNVPQLLIIPSSGVTANTGWSTAGTGAGIVLPDASTGNFIEFRRSNTTLGRMTYHGRFQGFEMANTGASGFQIYKTQSTAAAETVSSRSGLFGDVATGIRLASDYQLAFSSNAAGVADAFTVDLILSRAAAASLQLGANTATASATATGQTLKGPNATGTTSTGGSLTLAGGTGTSAGGAVIISTAATTTQTERARFSSAGVTIGASGTAIASVISATATLDFPSTNSHSASALTITVTGAAVGDVVALGIPTEAIGTNGVFFGYVSAADTVTVRFCNTDSGPATDPASGTFRATVIKH